MFVRVEPEVHAAVTRAAAALDMPIGRYCADAIAVALVEDRAYEATTKIEPSTPVT